MIPRWRLTDASSGILEQALDREEELTQLEKLEDLRLMFRLRQNWRP